jgi:predicted GIY-YIG superfamily endonuclease
MSTNIFILKLESGKYYIGKSSDPISYFQDHLVGKGSVWTRKYKPISLEKVIPHSSPFDEDKYTEEYMMKYGIQNVRGGSYVTEELEEEQVYLLQREIWAATNKCTRCGRGSHFVATCNARTTIDGKEIDEEFWFCEKCDAEFSDKEECENHERRCEIQSQFDELFASEGRDQALEEQAMDEQTYIRYIEQLRQLRRF